MTSPKERNGGLIRADLLGGWEGDKVDVFQNINLNPLQSEIRGFVKKLLNWRKTATAIHNGKLIHFAPEDGIYSYFRFNEKEKYFVVLNKNHKEVSLHLEKYKGMIPDKPSFEDVLDGSEFQNEVRIPAKSFRILKVK
jgi:glycosidase